MARKLDPYRKTARMVLEPWLIETALSNLDRKLNPAEQQTIVKSHAHSAQGQVAGLVERAPLTRRLTNIGSSPSA